MREASTLYRLLGDPTRLRLLRVLAEERCNVSELTAVLDLAQSSVSRHLGLLKDAGLVAEDRQGGYAYYSLAREDDARAPLWALLRAQFADGRSDRTARQDGARLREVLLQRRERFDGHGDARHLLPGRSWAAWSRALGHLLPRLDVADIGCGEGHLAIEAAAWAQTVVGIDRSDDVLERAKALAERRGIENVTWKKGDLGRLPLRDASVDVALMAQALHHASDPERALAEAARVLRPRGRLLVLELKAHEHTWVRERFGDRHLGFTDAALDGLLRAAGFDAVRVTPGARRAGGPFSVLVASGLRPPLPPGSPLRASTRREAPARG